MPWIHPDSYHSLLGLLFVMTFVGNGGIPVPLPVTPFMVWLGHFHHPIPIILIATTASVLGWWVADTLLRKRLIRWVQETGRVQDALNQIHEFFSPPLADLLIRKPEWGVLLFNSLPFPWDPSRVLALVNDYPLKRILISLTIARLIRYTLLVTVGDFLSHYQTAFMVLIAVLTILPVGFGIRRYLQHRANRDSSTPVK